MRFALPSRLALAAFPVLALAALTGCGGGSSTPPEAAWVVNMVQSDPQQCTIDDNTAQIGSVTNSNIGSTEINGMVDMNMNTIMVSCTVAGSGPYSVQAQASEGADILQITIPSISSSATMANPATGEVSYESAATADEPYSGSCDFYFESSMGVAIAPGRIWVAFQCAGLTSQMSTCPVNESYAVFEDCLEQAEM